MYEQSTTVPKLSSIMDPKPGRWFLTLLRSQLHYLNLKQKSKSVSLLTVHVVYVHNLGFINYFFLLYSYYNFFK